jgi:hypothetical protein
MFATLTVFEGGIMNIPHLLAAGAFACAAASTTVPAAANMVGDTLTFNRGYPTPTTPFWDVPSRTTTVTTDSSDLIDWTGSGFRLTIDPGADAIVWNLITPSSFLSVPGGQFDGFRITGFGADIAAVSVSANNSNLAVATSFAGRVLDVALSGGNFGGATGFVLDVSLVPEPSSVALLLAGIGIVTLASRRRPSARAAPQAS